MNSKTKRILIEELTEILGEEHPGCEDNTCLINQAMAEKHPYHILECFAGSGAASDRFSKLFARLSRQYRNPWKTGLRDARRICKTVPHMECSCNAVIWDQHDHYCDGENIQCSSCGAVSAWKGETK